jgi:hypothetical protein
MTMLGNSVRRRFAALTSALFVLVATLGACSGADDDGSGGGAMTDGAGAGGAAGTSGAGAAGAGGSAGSTASAAKLADLGFEVPEAIASSCAVYAKAVCSLFLKCAPSETLKEYVNAADCERSRQDGCRLSALPGVTIDATKFGPCTNVYDGLACDWDQLQEAGKKFGTCTGHPDAHGALADGASCHIDAQCAGGTCESTGQKVATTTYVVAEIDEFITCGLCKTTSKKAPSPEGAACLSSHECQAGLWCPAEGKQGHCTKEIPLGEKCLSDGCTPDAVCTKGVCALLPKVGESWGFGGCADKLICLKDTCSERIAEGAMGCISSSDCQILDDFQCVKGTCLRDVVVGLGESCADAYCGVALKCDKKVCVPDEPGEGEPCQLSDAGGAPAFRCGVGLYCDGKVCVPNKLVSCP